MQQRTLEFQGMHTNMTINLNGRLKFCMSACLVFDPEVRKTSNCMISVNCTPMGLTNTNIRCHRVHTSLWQSSFPPKLVIAVALPLIYVSTTLLFQFTQWTVLGALCPAAVTPPPCLHPRSTEFPWQHLPSNREPEVPSGVMGHAQLPGTHTATR